jgi:hypothetical protein
MLFRAPRHQAEKPALFLFPSIKSRQLAAVSYDCEKDGSSKFLYHIKTWFFEEPLHCWKPSSFCQLMKYSRKFFKRLKKKEDCFKPGVQAEFSRYCLLCWILMAWLDLYSVSWFLNPKNLVKWSRKSTRKLNVIWFEKDSLLRSDGQWSGVPWF